MSACSVADKRQKDVVVFLENAQEALNAALLREGERVARFLKGNLYAISGEVDPQEIMSKLQDIPLRVMLFANTGQGEEMAPVLARRFGTVAVTDCFDIRFRGSGLFYARYVYGGQFEQEVWFERPPEFVSLDTDSLEDNQGFAPALEVSRIQLEKGNGACKKRVLRRIMPDPKTVDIRYATRIVDIGAGCDQSDLIALAKKLAGLLGASIGASRAVVDGGSFPKTRMIGQTGKTVSPEFILTLGISGSPHHMGGIKGRARIISVNRDAQAPVFNACDEGFVADLGHLLPQLIRRIEQYRDQGLA